MEQLGEVLLGSRNDESLYNLWFGFGVRSIMIQVRRAVGAGPSVRGSSSEPPGEKRKDLGPGAPAAQVSNRRHLEWARKDDAFTACRRRHPRPCAPAKKRNAGGWNSKLAQLAMKGITTFMSNPTDLAPHRCHTAATVVVARTPQWFWLRRGPPIPQAERRMK